MNWQCRCQECSPVHPGNSIVHSAPFQSSRHQISRSFSCKHVRLVLLSHHFRSLSPEIDVQPLPSSLFSFKGMTRRIVPEATGICHPCPPKSPTLTPKVRLPSLSAQCDFPSRECMSLVSTEHVGCRSWDRLSFVLCFSSVNALSRSGWYYLDHNSFARHVDSQYRSMFELLYVCRMWTVLL